MTDLTKARQLLTHALRHPFPERGQANHVQKWADFLVENWPLWSFQSGYYRELEGDGWFSTDALQKIVFRLQGDDGVVPRKTLTPLETELDYRRYRVATARASSAWNPPWPRASDKLSSGPSLFSRLRFPGLRPDTYVDANGEEIEISPYETLPGAVVYIVAEGVAGLSKRLKAWCSDKEVSDVSRLYLLADTPQLAESADVDQLVSDLRAQISEPISLIVIDTMARCFVGKDENSAKDVGRLIQCADRLRKELSAAVLLVHHTTKHGDAERGSSALRGACETMISAESTSTTIAVNCEKQKDAAPFARVKLRLHAVGGSCIVRLHTDDESADTALKTNDVQCLTALGKIEGDDGATAGAWQISTGLSDSTFYRCRLRLVNGGYVENDDRHYRLSDKGQAEVLSLPPNSQQLS
jgi:AAA domain-containing protein